MSIGKHEKNRAKIRRLERERAEEVNRLKELLTAAHNENNVLNTIMKKAEEEGRIIVQEVPDLPPGAIVQMLTQDDIDHAREEGIIEGIRIYGVEIHGALYDLRETLTNIFMLSTLSHNNDSRAALSVLESDLVNHWGAFDKHVKHLKDAASIDTDQDWLNELNINVNDIRDAIIAYTSPTINTDERTSREKHFRAVCQNINPVLAKVKTIIESVPLRKRVMDNARRYIAYRLKDAFHDTRRGAPTEAGYALLDELSERLQKLSKAEKAAYDWLHGFKDDRRRFGQEINALKNQALRMSEDN